MIVTIVASTESREKHGGCAGVRVWGLEDDEGCNNRPEWIHGFFPLVFRSESIKA